MKMVRGVAVGCAWAWVAVVCSPAPAAAFAPGGRVQAPARRAASGPAHLGPLTNPRRATSTTTTTAAANTASGADAVVWRTVTESEFAEHATTRYDGEAFFDGFMTNVIDKVNAREELEIVSPPRNKDAMHRFLDTALTVTACLLAMQFFGVWMALGVWVARRADAVLESTFSAASDAQALVLAFATGSPLDKKSRQLALANTRRQKWQRRASELASQDDLFSPPAVLTTATVVPEQEPVTILDSICEPAGGVARGPSEEQRTQMRELEARKAREEMWELSKDIAFISSHHARKSAQFAATKLKEAATGPKSRRAARLVAGAVGVAVTTSILSGLFDKIQTSAHP